MFNFFKSKSQKLKETEKEFGALRFKIVIKKMRENSGMTEEIPLENMVVVFAVNLIDWVASAVIRSNVDKKNSIHQMNTLLIGVGRSAVFGMHIANIKFNVNIITNSQERFFKLVSTNYNHNNFEDLIVLSGKLYDKFRSNLNNLDELDNLIKNNFYDLERSIVIEKKNDLQRLDNFNKLVKCIQSIK